MIGAQVHRFGDAVALWIGTGETRHLSAQEARQLARALNRVAKSCETESAGAATCGTFAFSFGEAGQ